VWRRESSSWRVSTGVARPFLVCLVAILSLAAFGRAALAGPDLEIVELLLVPATSDDAVQLEDGHWRVTGDVYVTAILRNTGTDLVRRYRVDFFATEGVTRRTGRISDSGVEAFGIPADSTQTVRPSVIWRTGDEATSSGIYEITVTATLLDDVDDDLENNTYPPITGADNVTLTPTIVIVNPSNDQAVVPMGPYPFRRAEGEADGTQFVPERGCVYGHSYLETPTVATAFVNLSPSDELLQSADLEFECAFRPCASCAWQDCTLDEGAWRLPGWPLVPVEEAFAPGEARTFSTQISPRFLHEILSYDDRTPSLGEFHELQFDFTMSKNQSSLWSLRLPLTSASLRFAGPADAWVFPGASGCSGFDTPGEVPADRPPTVARGGDVAFVVRTEAIGDVIYALNRPDGEPLWAEPIRSTDIPGSEADERTYSLTSVTAVTDPESSGDAWLLYVGWSDNRNGGGVASFRHQQLADGTYGWVARWNVFADAGGTAFEEVLAPVVAGLPQGVSIEGGTTRLADLMVFASSNEGVWMIEETGVNASPTVTRVAQARVQRSPLYIQETGELWYVDTEGWLWYAGLDGSPPARLSTGEEEEEITTSPSVAKYSSGGSLAEWFVFVGTEDGNVHAYDTGSLPGENPRWLASVHLTGDTTSDIQAMTVWSDVRATAPIGDARVFAASDAGEIFECYWTGSSFSGHRKALEERNGEQEPVTLRFDENTGLLVVDSFSLVTGNVPTWLYVTARERLEGFVIPSWTPANVIYPPAAYVWSKFDGTTAIDFSFVATEKLTAPVIDGGTILVASENGSVYAFYEATNKP